MVKDEMIVDVRGVVLHINRRRVQQSVIGLKLYARYIAERLPMPESQ